MIEIKNLSLKYGKDVVLNNVSISLPRTGLVALIGPSGSGKTSIFNCLSGLIKYDGEIIFNGINLKNKSTAFLNNFRLNNIGFIFQDFKLFNLDSVEHNVAFPLDVVSGYSSFRNKKRIDDLLSLVGLKDKGQQIVNTLSGGEKQRVAIARSLVNNPKLILADEPTGALDENNGVKIMELLSAISHDKLVIIVSHDKELVSKYADKIIELKDGKIVNICVKKQQKEKENLFLISKEFKKKHASIPSLFLLRHTLMSIKERKWRSLLINMVTSLGLIGVGLAVSLSSTISNNIKAACSNLVSEDEIMISSKVNNKIVSLESKNYDEIYRIKSRYQDYIKDIGAIYHYDSINFFKNLDQYTLISNKTKIDINNYQNSMINECINLSDVDKTIYPTLTSDLANDEIVISLSRGMVHSICLELQIFRSVESLASYIKDHDVYLLVSLKNNDWQYYDEHLLKVKGFVLEYDYNFYHTNRLWNQYMYEDVLRFPTNLNLVTSDAYPWTLKKQYYIEFYDEIKRDEFLKLARYDSYLDSFLFDIANYQSFPKLYKYEDDTKYILKALVYKNEVTKIPFRMVNKIMEEVKEIHSPILGTASGYAIYQDALMMGFASFTYFAFDKDLLTSTLEEYASISTLGNQDLVLPKNMEVGHYSKSLNNGVIFKPLNSPIISGNSPMNTDEIALSTALYSALDFKAKNVLYMGIASKEEKLRSGRTIRDFKIVELKVVGLVASEEKVIYQNPDWLIDFYLTRVGISNFELMLDTISFSLNENENVDKTVNKIKKAFPALEVNNPISKLNEGIDEICFYLQLAMMIFSIVAILISVFLLSTCNYLHILEIQKDIGLSRCIGVSALESTRFIYFHSYLVGFISFIFATLELVVANVLISKVISHQLSTSFIFTFEPTSIIYMFLLFLAISSISSLLISLKVIKLSPLESLKIN